MGRIAVELNDTGLLLARSGADGQPVVEAIDAVHHGEDRR